MANWKIGNQLGPTRLTDRLRANVDTLPEQSSGRCRAATAWTRQQPCPHLRVNHHLLPCFTWHSPTPCKSGTTPSQSLAAAHTERSAPFRRCTAPRPAVALGARLVRAHERNSDVR